MAAEIDCVSGDAARQRLVVVLKSDGVGGVERFLSGVIPAFAACGVDVELVCHDPRPTSPGFLAGHPITTLDSGGLPGLLGRARQARALRRLIGQTDDCAAVIGMGPVANALVSITRSRSGPPVIVCERGNPFIERRHRWNRWFGWTYGRADVLVVQSEALARELRASWRHTPRVAVLPNPVPAAAPVRQPAEGRDPVIAAVGRLVPMKGFAELIDAVARLGAGGDGWSLVVIGDGPERPELEAQATRLGLADRITFAGTHLAPWELLANASIFALCSQHEGYPNALLEAMASGCAVVAADCRFGPSEMVEHGVSGLLYPVGDVERLAHHLEALIQDADLRLALARESTAWAARQTAEGAVMRWLELIDAHGK